MKKIILILLLLFPLYNWAQQYTITVDGYIGRGPSGCGSNNNGLKWIKLFFSDGSEEYLFRQDRGQFYNQDYPLLTRTYPNTRRVVRIGWRTVSRDRNSFGDCSRSWDREAFQTISSPCFYAYYNKDDIYQSRINRGWASVSIVPTINLSYRDGTSATSIYPGCETGGINIDASTGHTPANEVYQWEFLDPVNTETRNHPDYQALINAEAQAEGNYQSCIRVVGDPDRCEIQFRQWMQAQRALNTYTGPRTIQVPIWRPIPNKTGQARISLSLSDLYSSSADRLTAVNRNIDIRLRPGCNLWNSNYNILSVIYLPDPPSIARTPRIEQPSCSYEDDADFMLFFDRQVHNYEQIDINLLRRNSTNVYVPYDNNTNIRSLVNQGGGIYAYDWRPSTGRNLIAGQYRIQVSGYNRSNGAPFCQQYEYDFTITSPSRVIFNAEKIRDEICPDSNDGQLRITAQGGTGSYQYSINNGVSWQNLPATSYVVNGLAPGNYRVQVRDSNGCLDKESLSDPNKNILITINTKNEITHTVGIIVPPGAPGISDASINFSAVNGGTFIVDNGISYVNYTLYINGSNSNTRTGRAISNGFTIVGIPAGNHQIQYSDANGCLSQRFNLPEIRDPQPISFTIQKTDPDCYDANNGEINVINISGGYSPYSFSWTRNGIAYRTGTSSITGDNATYAVVVTDARSGRTELRNITFDNVPLPITITNIDIQPILCYGGDATVTIGATGGSSGIYQYALWNGVNTVWQDSNIFLLQENTSTGYQFRVRDRNANSCVSDISSRQFISQPDEITITSFQVNSNNVYGGSIGVIDLSISGGRPNTSAPFYQVSWTRNGVPISQTGSRITGLLAGDYIATITDSTGSCSITSQTFNVSEPDELLVNIVEETPIDCNGGVGVLRADVTGGSLNYTYRWYREGAEVVGQLTNTLTNATIGNYRVVINDRFTNAETTYYLGQPELLALSVTKNDVLCFEGNSGEIILNPSGGTRPYSFSIDNKITFVNENDLNNLVLEGLIAGDYDVWLRDANNCEIDTPIAIEINQPTEIEISEVLVEPATTVGGTNGSIDIEVVGGTGTLTYNWSRAGDATFTSANEDLINLSAGIYTVTVTDANNCNNSLDVEILEPEPMVVNVEISIPILCFGDALGELYAVVSGGFPIQSTPEDFEYSWYLVDGGTETLINSDLTIDRLSDIPAGTYRIVARDNQGTEADATIVLTQPDELIVTLDNAENINCYGEFTGAINITVTGGPIDQNTGDYFPYSFRWSKIEDSGFESLVEDPQNLTSGTYGLVVVDENLCTASLSEPVILTQPDAPLEITNVIATNLTGYQTGNGSIAIDVTGGTQPYTYEWSNTDDASFLATTEDIESLSIGNYELLITDALGCLVSLQQEITQPDQLLAQITPLSVDQGIQCNGEETLVPIAVMVTGGVGQYSYQWYEVNTPADILYTDPFTETLPAGIYEVLVVDENNNQVIARYEVEEPTALLITETVTDILCYNELTGIIDIDVSGGVPPYQYSWSNGEITEDLSGLRAGTYTITVIDANLCVIIKDIDVQQPNELFVTINRQYPSSSDATDGRIEAIVSGGVPPYRYEWFDDQGNILPFTSNILNNVGSEKYGLTIYDANNCQLVLDDIDLYEPPVLEVVIEQRSVISCNGNENTGSLIAIVSGGVPFNSAQRYEFQWYNAITNLPIGGQNQILSAIGAGLYVVEVTDAVGTVVRSEMFDLQEPDVLEIAFDADYVNCGDGTDWTLTSVITGGTPPYRYRWSTGHSANELVNITAGTYGLTVTDSRGCIATNQITTIAPEPLMLSFSTTIPTCYGGCDGTIDIDVFGGTPPYSFNWSNDIVIEDLIDVCAGEYTVLITDSKGCQRTDTIVINNPDQIIFDLGENVTLCADQTITLNATIDDDAAIYAWSSTNGFSSNEAIVELSEPGDYEIQITDRKGCIISDTVSISRSQDEINAEFIASTQVFVGEEFVVVNISDPLPDEVSWELPDEAELIFMDNNYAEMVINEPGEYDIMLLINRGLCSDIAVKRVSVIERAFDEDPDATPSDEEISKFEYRIYPNPAPNGQFSLDISLNRVFPVSVKIFNMVNNSLVAHDRMEGRNAYLVDYSLSALPSGIYFVLIETQGQSQVRKLVIQ